MNNYRAEGDVLEFTAPSGGVVVGSGYRIGSIFGVATVTAAAGEKFSFLTEGVVSLPKVPTEPWAEGALIYFNPNASGGLATSTSGILGLIGFAAAATVNPSATGLVRLNGTARQAGYS